MSKQPKYYLNKNGEFVIENYNYAKPFADFFPGIAGKFGIPMWTFFVNRGQAIASFGVKDKDHPILEFRPANNSWQFTPSFGFRTFIKVLGKKPDIYEPFHNGFVNTVFDLNNSMALTSHDLKLKEINSTLGLEVNVEYFNIPSDVYAGLARIVRVKNTSKKQKYVEILDGLPQIVPYGTNDYFLKKMSRTIEAWTQVENLENNVPFFRLAVDPADKPEVVHIKEGNFYLSFHHIGGKKILKPIVNPQAIFGQNTDFSTPIRFLKDKPFKLPGKEITESRTPCAFSFISLSLKPGEEVTFNAVIGFMRSLDDLNNSISRISTKGYLDKKRLENKKVIEDLLTDVETKSGSIEFDLYTKQTYLDNILRGGYPEVFKNGSKEKVFYVYNRKHGDLERDYNEFLLEPTYYSQGNGNYRDLNQNRRTNIWFNPEIKETDLFYLLNLIQLDGFNPLIVKGNTFAIKDKNLLKSKLNGLLAGKDFVKLASFLTKPFSPGEVILFIQDNNINLKTDKENFLNLVISAAEEIQDAVHGEGFWSDHWAYNLDLLESYIGVYPDKLIETLFKNRCFTYFDNTEIVKPRNKKYVLYNGLPRQLHSAASDAEKKMLIKRRLSMPNMVRDDFGKGRIYHTTLIDKLVCLFANKIASLDPFCCGIEMEANKPNWYDALNGLPALFGSSLCETFELKRLAVFLRAALIENNTHEIELTKEVSDFLLSLGRLLAKNTSDFVFWDKSHGLKEDYRRITRLGISGKKSKVRLNKFLEIIDAAIKKINKGLSAAYDAKNGVYYSYFINEPIAYQIINNHFVKIRKFKQLKLPLFLEGQMHALRLSKDTQEAAKLAWGTKNSPLFDRKLKMYKVTAALKNMPEEIGRCRIFSPGWLENESIWLHMEYKYILELLKAGLYKEFYEDFGNVLIPFLKPESYGRSTLENSSFLVSSAFTDKSLHGNGFVARLSGSTAEFLQIWLLMNLGKTPFFLGNDGDLNLRFNPILSGRMFDKNGIYSFKFLSKTIVTYYNPGRKDTFGKNAARVKKIVLIDPGFRKEFVSDTVSSPYAEQVRSRQISKIDIYLK